jgi:dihydroorotate dehydrogenase
MGQERPCDFDVGPLGIRFGEIGSVSADPSSGNPRPRLFRLPDDGAIVVNHGLPNHGAEVVARRLARRRASDVYLGVNIVNTNRGPAVQETEDDILANYARSARLLGDRADYLVLNLSCPNAGDTARAIDDVCWLARLLAVLAPLELRCPVFLKLLPSSDPRYLEAVLQTTDRHRFIRGFLFNLATGKPDGLPLRTPRHVWQHWPGAVAGKPAAGYLDQCIRALYPLLPKDRHAIIGGGGVFTAEDAFKKIKLGASLVQIYTALVYEGPAVVRRINQGLCRLVAADGFRNISEAVGIEAKR